VSDCVKDLDQPIVMIILESIDHFLKQQQEKKALAKNQTIISKFNQVKHFHICETLTYKLADC